MNTESEQLDQVLRKAFEAVDRKKTLTVVVMLGSLILGVGVLYGTAQLSTVSSPDLLRHEILGGFVGLAALVAGLAAALIREIKRNTRAVLKAISLLPGSKSE